MVEQINGNGQETGLGDGLLSAQQVADYLGVPLATLYGWRHRGSGPQGFRVGRHLRFRAIDLEEWIVEQLAESQQRSSGQIPTAHAGRVVMSERR